MHKNKILRLFVAYYDGEPAGVGEMFRSERTAKLEDLFVNERYRNKGIATEILRAMMHNGKQDGVHLFYLGTYEDDEPIHLYRKLGFKVVSSQYKLCKVFNEK